MAKLTGKNLYVTFGTTVLSAAQKSFEVTETMEQADVTAGADDYRNFLATVKTIEATMEMVMREHSDGGSAILASLYLGDQRDLVWGVEGTATGKPRDGFRAMLVERTKTMKFDDAYVLKLKWVNYGTAILYNGVTATW